MDKKVKFALIGVVAFLMVCGIGFAIYSATKSKTEQKPEVPTTTLAPSTLPSSTPSGNETRRSYDFDHKDFGAKSEWCLGTAENSKSKIGSYLDDACCQKYIDIKCNRIPLNLKQLQNCFDLQSGNQTLIFDKFVKRCTSGEKLINA